MHVVNGYEVSFSVEQTDAAGRYRVKLVTIQKDGGQRRTWEIPGGRFFTTEVEADRYGRYVILGLRSVGAGGQPMYTVI